MAYLPPTPSDVRADFPAFGAVDDAAIQRRIDRTGVRIDEGWGENYTYARSLLTAHYLAEDGFGGSGDAQIDAFRSAGVARFKSGTLDVSFADSGASASGSEYSGTVYGLRFQALMNRLFAGPLTTGGGHGCVAGAATDVPWAWRTGGWGL